MTYNEYNTFVMSTEHRPATMDEYKAACEAIKLSECSSKVDSDTCDTKTK